MSVLRSLAELRAECQEKGLQVDFKGKKETKKHYIEALASHSLSKRSVTPGLKFRLGMESPQLAFLGDNLRKEEMAEIFRSDEWVFEEKLNGVRMVIFYDPETGFEMFGRNVSVQDFLPTDYTGKVYLGPREYRGLFPAFAVDCELCSDDPNVSTVLGKRGVVTETILQAVSALISLNTEDTISIQKQLATSKNGSPVLNLHVFDILMYEHKDLKPLPYRERRRILLPVIEMLRQVALPFHKVKAVQKNKQEYLQELWASGKEGCIAKRIDMPYIDRESRPRGGWIKLKRRVSMGATGDTVDGWISGYELGTEGKGYENLVGVLYVSVNLQCEDGTVRTHEIAHTANMPLEMRKEITTLGPDGKPVIKPEMYGKVVEVEGQAVSARALRLVHPRFIRMRPDKNASQCVMTEAFLKSQIL